MTTSAGPAAISTPLYLLDTNIVVHYARGKNVGQQIEADYSFLTTPYRPLICIVTHGEILAFAGKRNWGRARVSVVRNLLAQFVTLDIHHPQVLDAYADIDVQSQNPLGRKMGKNDLWIAAVGHVARASLITTDADFDHLNGRLLDVIKIDPMTGRTI